MKAPLAGHDIEPAKPLAFSGLHLDVLLDQTHELFATHPGKLILDPPAPTPAMPVDLTTLPDAPIGQTGDPGGLVTTYPLPATPPPFLASAPFEDDGGGATVTIPAQHEVGGGTTPETAVPEPSCFTAVVMAGLLLRRRGRAGVDGSDRNRSQPSGQSVTVPKDSETAL